MNVENEVEAENSRRHPAGLFAIALLLGPWALMLWMGRFKASLVYFFISQFVVAAFVFLAMIGLVPLSSFAGLDPSMVYWLILSPAILAALAHAWQLNKQSPQRPWYSRWFVALTAYALIALPIAYGIRTFLFQPFNVPSASNAPNLEIGDYFFVSKREYVLRDPHRGELAAFKKPNGPPTDYVKRVIGLPGDRVQMKSGILYLNGAAVPRTKADIQREYYSKPEKLVLYRESLPGGPSYLVAEVSDNERLDDTPEFVVPENNYFVLGDNRDNSVDSRMPSQVGFVPRANFIGPVTVLFWNTNGEEIVGRPN